MERHHDQPCSHCLASIRSQQDNDNTRPEYTVSRSMLSHPSRWGLRLNHPRKHEVRLLAMRGSRCPLAEQQQQLRVQATSNRCGESRDAASGDSGGLSVLLIIVLDSLKIVP